MQVKRVDSTDENVSKYVFDFGNAVAESVLYKYHTYEDRTVICCSTQSGCPVGCRFCGAGPGITPNKEIQRAATEYVRSQNELKIKENEVQIAKKEAERQAILSTNAGQSIAYMQAQSQLMIAQAVKEGKVQTIIIPSNLTALGNIAK